jgi:hypothetical protein
MKDRLLDKVIRFDILLGIVALTIALVAAFFSVYGIATLFAGAFVSTAIMASVLEVGKLVSVTYLYRYWKQTKRWLSAYLSLALILLMVITSGGIFGYLSAAYQKSSGEYKAQQDQIVLVERTKTYSQNKIDSAQNRILALQEMRKAQEARLSEALTNNLVARNPVLLRQMQDQTAQMIEKNETDTKAEQSKIDNSIKETQSIDQRISELKYSGKNKDIKTFEFVAKLFNTDLDHVAKWFIFMLIVVFDPLAVALVLAYNVVSYKNSLVTETPEEEPKPLRKSMNFSFPFQKTPKMERIIEESPPPPSPEPDPFIKAYFK